MLKTLIPPFTRSEMILLRKAANEGWSVGTETKQQIANGVRATRDAEDATTRTKKSAGLTLVAFLKNGWIG